MENGMIKKRFQQGLMIAALCFCTPISAAFAKAAMPKKIQHNDKQINTITPPSFDRQQLLDDAGALLPASVYPKDQKQVKKPGKQLKQMSLREAILIALRFNPDVTNAEIDRISEKYNLRTAQWAFEWQYKLNGDVQYRQIRNSGDGGSFEGTTVNINPSVSKHLKTGADLNLRVDNPINEGQYQPSATVEVVQPLLKGAPKGVVLKPLNDALDQEQVSRLSLKKNISSIIRRVISDYRSLIEANNTLINAKRSYKDALKTYHDNAIQIKLGKLPRTDNVTQKAQVENLKLQMVQAENGKNRGRQQLLEDMGLDPDTAIDVPNDAQIEILKVPDLNKTLTYAYKSNIDYLVSKINRETNRRAYQAANDDTRWQLDLNASATVGSSDLENQVSGIDTLLKGRNHSETVGLKLTVPINQVDLKANLSRAKVQLEKDKNDFQKQKRALQNTIKNLITDLKSQSIQIKISENSVKLQQQNYALQKKKQQLGKGTSIDVTNSQNQLIDARNALINNKITYLNTLSELRETLGITLDYWKVDIRY